MILGAVIPSLFNSLLNRALSLVLGQNITHTGIFLWLANCSGILLITPLLLRIGLGGKGLWQREHKRSRLVEASICLGLLVTIGWVIFASKHLNLTAFDNGMRHAQYLELFR
jgi:integral membrane sensor domain MASE1